MIRRLLAIAGLVLAATAAGTVPALATPASPTPTPSASTFAAYTETTVWTIADDVAITRPTIYPQTYFGTSFTLAKDLPCGTFKWQQLDQVKVTSQAGADTLAHLKQVGLQREADLHQPGLTITAKGIVSKIVGESCSTPTPSETPSSEPSGPPSSTTPTAPPTSTPSETFTPTQSSTPSVTPTKPSNQETFPTLKPGKPTKTPGRICYARKVGRIDCPTKTPQISTPTSTTAAPKHSPKPSTTPAPVLAATGSDTTLITVLGIGGLATLAGAFVVASRLRSRPHNRRSHL